jgi:ribosomal protein S18 acetylase RimI-like enzyme
MEFRLRDYTPADFETLYEIDRACFEQGIAYSRAELAWYLSRRGSIGLVVEAQGPEGPVLAGFIVAQAARRTACIITIDVLQEYRRAGVGTTLLRETERRLAKMNVRNVELQTAVDNGAGVAFWKRHGYRTSGIAPAYYLGRTDAYLMTKSLAPDTEN